MNTLIERISSWKYGNIQQSPFLQIFPEAKKIKELTILNPYKRVLDVSIDLNELVYLCSIEKIIKARRVLEIGTYNGNTTLNLSRNIGKSGRVITVDLPENWEGKHELFVSSKYFNVHNLNKIGNQFKGTRYEKSIIQIRIDSALLDTKDFSEGFDLIFIDGCHNKSYIKSDSEFALKVINKKGVIIWHDYGMHKHVSNYIDEFNKSKKVEIIEGTRLAVFRK